MDHSDFWNLCNKAWFVLFYISIAYCVKHICRKNGGILCKLQK